MLRTRTKRQKSISFNFFNQLNPSFKTKTQKFSSHAPHSGAEWPFKPHIDLHPLRDSEKVESILKNIQSRGMDETPLHKSVSLYKESLDIKQRLSEMRHQRKLIASKIGSKTISQEEREQLVHDGKSLKSEVSALEEVSRRIESSLLENALLLPNDTHPNVPHGEDDDAAVCLRTGGGNKIESDHLYDHSDLCSQLGIVDFESGAKVTGTKGYFLVNAGAQLETALIGWAMDQLHRFGFQTVTTPDMVRSPVFQGCGFQPRGPHAQVYHVEDSDLCLSATSEIPLAGLFSGAIVKKDTLPIRFVATGHCFRREAGSGGKESKGLYRVHQFSKVEMFAATEPEESNRSLMEMVDVQQHLLNDLGIHYRVMDMPTGELGAPAHRKIDIEGWFPGSQRWGELTSASNCTDYQSRRLFARYRTSEGLRYLHTVNGTALAVSRILIALLETHQQNDGSVIVPEVLKPWMNGMELITPKPLINSYFE